MILLGKEVNENFERVIKGRTRKEFDTDFYCDGDSLYNYANKHFYICCPLEGNCIDGHDNCKECWEMFISAAVFKGESKKDDLISFKNSAGLFVNEFTAYLDRHTLKDKLNDVFCNYVYHEPYDAHTYLIRYPGATRGKIVVGDDMTIMQIGLYEDCNNFIYDGTVGKDLTLFVGRKLVFG